MKFTEWIQYYMMNPYPGFDYSTFVDKHKVKEKVKGIIKIAKEYAYFTTDEQIDDFNFKTLPDSFVIKATHGCGWNIVVDSDLRSRHSIVNFNELEANIKMRSWLRRKYRPNIEKQYAQLTPGVLIEEFLDSSKKLINYKFYCIGNEIQWIHVIQGEEEKRKEGFYDLCWNEISLRRRLTENIKSFSKPNNLDEVIRKVNSLLRLIGKVPFVRVDLFDCNEDVYFGEFTFSPASGTNQLEPDEYEMKYGRMLDKYAMVNQI